jgi:hypothetical protein
MRKPATMGFFFLGHIQALILVGGHDTESDISRFVEKNKSPCRSDGGFFCVYWKPSLKNSIL